MDSLSDKGTEKNKGATVRGESLKSFGPIIRNNKVEIAIAVLLLIFLGLFQLDSGPAGPLPYYPDSDYYVRNANGFRNLEYPSAPDIKSARLLVPFLAAILPGPIIASFFIVNMIFIILSALVLLLILERWGFSRTEKWLCVYLLLLMHPAIVYLLTPLVDAGMLFFILLGVYLIQERASVCTLMAVFALAVLVKETCLILIPVLFFYDFFENRKPDAGRYFFICAPALVLHIALVYQATNGLVLTYVVSTLILPLVLVWLFKRAKLGKKWLAPSYLVACLLLVVFVGGFQVNRYIIDEVIGKRNIELVVAFAPILPLVLLGLRKMPLEDKRRANYLSPLILPILMLFTYHYVESRLFISAYPLAFMLMIGSSKTMGRYWRPYCALMTLLYILYWAWLFNGKYLHLR